MADTRTSPEIGKAAPGFKLPASNGETVKLGDFRGRKVVLFFYPQDNTPTCTQEACDFRDANADFEQSDTVLIGISPDPVKSHLKFIEKQSLPFLLLSDEKLKAANAYGVWQEKQLYGRKYMGIVRSTFLIDRKGKLVREWRNVRLKGHIEAVLEAARLLK
ncbi:thioredoxin-dependent thiol peroxidase [Cohnella sp. CFH 77786]|uniref:thioredoxin-dependent thiol peroxidase n=1 Tax=Cohnella sp. CFH 77786 TaxID=2662265 RepID=UPI001C60D259|nr:thioredoxin-dependent thiol peroxidase [Cohnella sp. CFH 77786]MBW5445666.1 thioredoxin-dependent thiol peroxidase [Cohnella sp. CFH 77786]